MKSIICVRLVFQTDILLFFFATVVAAAAAFCYAHDVRLSAFEQDNR